MFSADGAPIALLCQRAANIKNFRNITIEERRKLFGFSKRNFIAGRISFAAERATILPKTYFSNHQPTEAVRVTVAETYFASWRGNFRSSTVTFCMGKLFNKCIASRSANVSIRLTD